MGMESKTTSKTSCLQALLLRAWRERWSDLQWGINIKTVLPRGVSGDVYNLADCILQQAVVGSGANQLVLSYLKHSLSSQLVSHAAVLQRLSKFSQLHKTHCVLSLLEFLEGVLPGVTCCGKSEETKLAGALLATTCWLLQVLQFCSATTHLVEKVVSLLNTLLTSHFCIAMMCLARFNDEDLFADVCKKCCELEISYVGKEEVLSPVHLLQKLDVHMLSPTLPDDSGPGCLVQAWLAVQLVGSPGSLTPELADRLRLFQHLKRFSECRLYAEIMRGSLLALHDVSQTSYESQWGAFAFLKVPHVLALVADKSDTSMMAAAIELLLQHTSLLDAMDANSSCSSLDCLLGELAKTRLLTDSQVSHLSSRREVPSCLKLDTTSSSAGIPKVIICAEPTLAGILKTLSTDYHKIQDALLGMLHQVLTGKSFELILAVATVQGQLRTLVARLIRVNECSKLGGDKARALFDISFLMLVAIVQNYGADAVLEPIGDSLFEQWVCTCMVEAIKPKAPDQLLRNCDSNTVDTLLQQFNAGEADFKSTFKWTDVLFNMAGVMKEVLVAWEQGALLAADVKRILDAVRGRMCCLPLAAAAWLCAYMRTAPQETILKPVNMVQQLLQPPVAEDDSLRERWQLTCEVIRKMQRDVQLPLPQKGGRQLVSRQPASEQLSTSWNAAINRGWLDHKSATAVHCLFDTAGARWLVSSVLQELLQLHYEDQLDRGVDLALALFHVNIQSCTIHLLTNSLPQLLFNKLQANSLTEFQLSALAHLTSYCIFASCEFSDDNDEPPVKLQKLQGVDEELLRALRKLLATVEIGLQNGFITQQMYFTIHLLRSLVHVQFPTAGKILKGVPPTLVSQLLKTLPELFTPYLLLHLHDVHVVSGRANTAKDLCILRNYQLRNVNA